MNTGLKGLGRIKDDSSFDMQVERRHILSSVWVVQACLTGLNTDSYKQ